VRQHRGFLNAAMVATTFFVAAACGDPESLTDAYGLETGAGAQSLAPLATLTAPVEGDHGWEFDAAHVRLGPFGDRQALYIDVTEEPLTVDIPLPRAANGAGHVELRVMSDGEFRLGVAFGENELPAVSAGSTRRQWRDLLIPLARPLAVEPGDRMTLRRESSALPVVIDSIRFIP
jgi:hypothetical protein